MDLRSSVISANDLAGIVRLGCDDVYGGNVYVDRCETIRTNRDGSSVIRFTLRVRKSNDKGAHIAASGRRTVSACWHAYRDALRSLFDADPNAVVSSALATYRGRADFLALFPGTYRNNVGSMVRPIRYGELCACGSDPATAIARIRNTPEVCAR